jgi:hypothetical protein
LSKNNIFIKNLLISIGDRFAGCFTIVDMSKVSRPCIHVNNLFTENTLYTKEEVIGNNLKFLQGKNTDPTIVEHMSSTFLELKASCVDIVNYKKDGTEIINRLVMLPIISKESFFYIGFQNIISVSDPSSKQQIFTPDAGFNHVVNNILSSIVEKLKYIREDDLTEAKLLYFCDLLIDLNQFCLHLRQQKN